MTLNCIIIDDEPLAAELLASYAKKVPFLTLQGTFNSATEAIKTIREMKIDLIFLDIQMPELSGLEFARIIGPETKIVFTTAFNQYAIEGYKVNALDYLLKPISFEKFLEAANKALSWFELRSKVASMKSDRFVFIKSEYKLQKASFDDILYIEGGEGLREVLPHRRHQRNVADEHEEGGGISAISGVPAHPPLLYSPHA